MGTTTEKLTYLQGTKDAIKNAIVAKGVAVPEGTTFRGYAEKVGEIPAGRETAKVTFEAYNDIGERNDSLLGRLNKNNGNVNFVDKDNNFITKGSEIKAGYEYEVPINTIITFVFESTLDDLSVVNAEINEYRNQFGEFPNTFIVFVTKDCTMKCYL